MSLAILILQNGTDGEILTVSRPLPDNVNLDNPSSVAGYMALETNCIVDNIVEILIVDNGERTTKWEKAIGRNHDYVEAIIQGAPYVARTIIGGKDF